MAKAYAYYGNRNNISRIFTADLTVKCLQKQPNISRIQIAINDIIWRLMAKNYAYHANGNRTNISRFVLIYIPCWFYNPLCVSNLFYFLFLLSPYRIAESWQVKNLKNPCGIKSRKTSQWQRVSVQVNRK